MKIIRFNDIPQFTRHGSWECDYDLEGVLRFISDERKLGLNMDPDFQRGHVWTTHQQSKWIEFFLRGGKTGRVLYFNHPGWHQEYKGEFVIVDGKQRCEAIRRFLGNEIKAFGSYYHEYTDKIRISGHTMRINVNTLRTRAEVLQWYIEFNSGGTPHSKEEITRVRKLLAAERRITHPSNQTGNPQ